MATARLMETWAHGQDVVDALGARREPTERLRHVAHIGVRTRNFAYQIRGETPPAEEFRVELVSPAGTLWTWGPDDAGAARCRVPRSTSACSSPSAATGPTSPSSRSAPDADHWLDIAQAFAGPPGPGRAPAASPSHPVWSQSDGENRPDEVTRRGSD